ncbi:hypothetical protein LCGC14_2388650, partial [marine sediment metagenome]
EHVEDQKEAKREKRLDSNWTPHSLSLGVGLPHPPLVTPRILTT